MAEPYFTFDDRVHPICQIGMSTTRQAEPTSWLDVACYVHEAELFRGRERFNERFEPGTASVTFDNRTGWADLGGTYTEVAAAELRPGRQIRIGVRGPWDGGPVQTRWLYRGFIDQATPAYDPTLHDVVIVNCIDALGEAGSSVAPTGDHQGVHETVSARLNRVLDAVGWWGGKRKIAATATTVQGTDLGQQAIDHLGVAADSAGGVVYGDLDGDVVFKDIDWMLYDPDTPPDDGIGNPPGGPGPGVPPYIDPTPGPVYDPDDPPAVHPPKVCVCADGTAGTLVEKGDNYRLYVKDGHLFYESSGHTWDLGPYSGGCTCVDPNPPGGDGPERSDGEPGEDPDDYEIVPTPEPELPPEFGVELLAWNDGGLADPPAASVTVAGVTPGHDCLLVTLISAIGALTDTAGLTPTVDGGGLDWAHTRGADRSGGVASSWIFVAQVGRDDPGTFDVVVTWTAPSTSRTHIVTVWKVTAAANDYLERFDAGTELYGITTSNLPDYIQPGDGPVFFPLASNLQPLDVDTPPRLVDITIAQSLAEEGTGPFGAMFNELNGPWTVVPDDTSTDDTFIDDFEGRTTIEPGWFEASNPTQPPGWWTVHDGYATNPGGYNTGVRYYLVRDSEYAGHSLWIEVEIADGWPLRADTGDPDDTHAYLNLRLYATSLSGTATSGPLADFELENLTTLPGPVYDLDTFIIKGNCYYVGDHDGLGQMTYTTYEGSAPVVRLGMQVEGNTIRQFIDGVLVREHTTTVALPARPRLAVSMIWDDSSPSVEPKVLSITGGSGNGDIVRKTSWVAGWRQGVALPTVALDDVNTGVDDIQSTQVALVLESAETEFGWRILGHNLAADVDTTTAAGTFTFNNPPRPGALLAVFVGVTAATDVMSAVTVTGADFSGAVAQPKTGASYGQGAVYTATAPLDLDEATWALTVAYPDCRSVSAVVWEVTDQDDVGALGATASGVLGDSTAGSVNGPSSITLSATGDAAAVVIAYLHVSTGDDNPSGASALDAWDVGLEYDPPIPRAYLHTMTRAPGQDESTSTDVHWADVQSGTATTYSGVQLALEVHPYDGLPPLTGAGAGVSLGGETDAWNGIIHKAAAYFGGEPIWTFP